MATSSKNLVELRGVSKTYGDHHVTALTTIDLSIREGEFLAIMGPSGCGKSTLLNIMGGIDKPTTGEVLLDGDNILLLNDEKLTTVRRRKIGYIFQFFNLLSTLTVAENVSLPLELDGKGAGELARAVANMLSNVHMSERARFYPAQLSGGEMQRVAIARALVHAPNLILADEPTGNLDTENGTAILELLRKINKEQGRTVVMATHSSEAASYADRLVTMRDGCITGEQQCCSLS
ncbi:MAG TPA: ABC transporter ATP-binding protein [Planktothrix sp.]|jgi:putative ABC transport system ATP-binding protein